MGVLIGVPIVAPGFALSFDALLVVTIAGVATGIAGGLQTVEIVSAFGKAFADNRYMGLIWLKLPVIALLEQRSEGTGAASDLAPACGHHRPRALITLVGTLTLNYAPFVETKNLVSAARRWRRTSTSSPPRCSN
ncbi:hypothetical protein OKW29_002946 [Paraburkholderia sp. CI3]